MVTELKDIMGDAETAVETITTLITTCEKIVEDLGSGDAPVTDPSLVSQMIAKVSDYVDAASEKLAAVKDSDVLLAIEEWLDGALDPRSVLDTVMGVFGFEKSLLGI